MYLKIQLPHHVKDTHAEIPSLLEFHTQGSGAVVWPMSLCFFRRAALASLTVGPRVRNSGLLFSVWTVHAML